MKKSQMKELLAHNVKSAISRIRADSKFGEHKQAQLTYMERLHKEKVVTLTELTTFIESRYKETVIPVVDKELRKYVIDEYAMDMAELYTVIDTIENKMIPADSDIYLTLFIAKARVKINRAPWFTTGLTKLIKQLSNLDKDLTFEKPSVTPTMQKIMISYLYEKGAEDIARKVFKY